MNPITSIQVNDKVVITKTVDHRMSNIKERNVGKTYSVEDIFWGGRKHNRFIEAVLLSDKNGNNYKAIVDQLASINPNYEPDSELITCTSCGVTILEKDLEFIKSISAKRCPYCGAIDPEES